MKAMIFAAGLGSRLKPLTDTMPKALVPIAGHPMLEHVILKLKAAGFTEIVINIHHFGEQILDFLEANENFGLIIHISDERDLLLDTGGGIKKARSFFENSDEPFLIHNVDILSDVNLKELYDYHLRSGAVATLLASQRKTSRYLLFDTDKRLCGWINKDTEQVKPEGFQYDSFSLSGICIQWYPCTFARHFSMDDLSLMGWKILYHGFLSCHLPASKLWWLLDRKVASD